MKSLPIWGILALAGMLAPALRADEILKDQFDYGTVDDFKVEWNLLDGRGPCCEIRKDDADAARGQWLFLRNALVQKDLPREIENRDWTLKFKVLQTDLKRGAWVGLFDKTRTKGYAVLWDSGNSTADNTGRVSIRKFALSEALADWSQNGELVGKAAPSGHANMELPMADFELSWKHDSGLLTAVVDGVELTSVVDTDFQDFSQVVIKGNFQMFDDISLSSP